eukprot:Colp12_sorted_trinity150504_noHs@12704
MSIGPQYTRLLDSDGKSECDTDRGSSDGSTTSNECAICFEDLMNTKRAQVTLICGHVFHLSCIGSEFNRSDCMQCPYCRRTENSEWTCKRARAASLTRVLSIFDLKLASVKGMTDVCLLCGKHMDKTTSSTRSIARLHCQHEFHFSCIGNSFNRRGRMECAICGAMEKHGHWTHMQAADGHLQRDTDLYPEADETTRLLHGGSVRSCCGRYWSTWFGVWTHGAIGESRLIRLLCVLVLAYISITIILSQEAHIHLLILISSLSFLLGSLPLIFAPALFLWIGILQYIALFVVRLYAGLYAFDTYELALEPVLSLLCVYMIFNFIFSYPERRNGCCGIYRNLGQLYRAQLV